MFTSPRCWTAFQQYFIPQVSQFSIRGAKPAHMGSYFKISVQESTKTENAFLFSSHASFSVSHYAMFGRYAIRRHPGKGQVMQSHICLCPSSYLPLVPALVALKSTRRIATGDLSTFRIFEQQTLSASDIIHKRSQVLVQADASKTVRPDTVTSCFGSKPSMK